MHIFETAAAYGVEHLSDGQLVSVLLNRDRRDRGEHLINQVGTLGHLLQLGPSKLRERGLSEAEATRVSIIPEALRRMGRGLSDRPQITSPRSAGAYLLPSCLGWTEERFGLLALNAKGFLLAERILSQGTASATLISPREFFREALRHGATTAIAWHNHPSGDPCPSREDVTLALRLRSARESLGVPLADHLILGRDRYHSFRAAEGWDAR